MAHKLPKTAFVTVGATASFDSLVEAALQPSFLRTLAQNGYTRLVIQFGKSDAAFFNNYLYNYADLNLHVEGFDFKAGDFRDAIRQEVSAVDGSREEGLMIAHAGE
jgi:beta-1,4-N-acetylglucosaminyltransferase